LCYRHENSSSEINGSELKDDKLAEDLVKLEGDQSDDLKKDWFAALHEVFTSFVLFWLQCKQRNYSLLSLWCPSFALQILSFYSWLMLIS